MLGDRYTFNEVGLGWAACGPIDMTCLTSEVSKRYVYEPLFKSSRYFIEGYEL